VQTVLLSQSSRPSQLNTPVGQRTQRPSLQYWPMLPQSSFVVAVHSPPLVQGPVVSQSLRPSQLSVLPGQVLQAPLSQKELAEPQEPLVAGSQAPVPQLAPLQLPWHSQPSPPVARSPLQSTKPSLQTQVVLSRQLALAPQPAAGQPLEVGSQTPVASLQAVPAGQVPHLEPLPSSLQPAVQSTSAASIAMVERISSLRLVVC
jgi:hypothetical protein